MLGKQDKRMRLLEAHSTMLERRTLAGLVRLVESGKLTVRDLTDEELEKLVAGLPGDLGMVAALPDDLGFNVSQLSDDELRAIIDG
jgi:hypothetical protein